MSRYNEVKPHIIYTHLPGVLVVVLPVFFFLCFVQLVNTLEEVIVLIVTAIEYVRDTLRDSSSYCEIGNLLYISIYV